MEFSDIEQHHRDIQISLVGWSLVPFVDDFPSDSVDDDDEENEEHG